jgi:hypothetical protein
MTQHVRVDGETEPGLLTGAGDDLAHRRIRHGAPPLGREEVAEVPCSRRRRRSARSSGPRSG